MAYESSSAGESIMSDVSRSSTVETSAKSEDEGRPALKGPKVKKSVLSLLDDAFRYSAYDEFSMPDGFLRSRSRKVCDGDQDATTLRPNANKIDENDKLAGRIRKGRKVKMTKMVTKATVTAQKTKRSAAYGRKNTDAQQVIKREPGPGVKKATSFSKGTLRKSTSSGVKRGKNGVTVAKGRRKKADIPKLDSFITNWESHLTKVTGIVDLDGLRNSSGFKEELVHSCNVHRPKSTHNRTVKLRYILYPDYFEEFVVNFKSDLSRYNPMSEIGRIIEFTCLVYVPPKYRPRMETQIIKPLNHSFDLEDQDEFVKLIELYNEFISGIPRPEILQQLASLRDLPTSFLHTILHMVYVRTIHPNAGALKKYQAFSNYVYGELLPKFLTTTYEKCGLKPEHIFMDLGSGVGNCVFQAALEFGCKLSFGCELMPNASALTEAQEKELRARCKLYGLNVGSLQFSLRKSFVGNPEVQELLPQCDVLLVNNFIFDAKLNELVRKLIQPLKVGCKIITLKSLRPFGHTVNHDNATDILNRLKVEKFELEEDSVSWTHRGGEFFISTVQEDIEGEIFTTHSKGRTRSKRVVKYTR
ncbi:LADA_0G08438g1_1 [Lachancea dasiensis]|uniref:Histone-lysine N-methyltransferase, H3 lysine-79 specific n=1 Tax=Lachancea dasiensis TaxID=1072105 RepID=A0A1G4JU18_9SACH|nr:LADA_0G08438g1_1 [Lachancea dasiensis]